MVLREYTMKTYAAYNKNEIQRINSSSGGIFYLLAEDVINKCGVVFGVCFNDKFEVVHSYVDTIEGISKLCGSKYVQSKIGDSYINVKEFLEKKRLVLFTGTPCQINGLKLFLNKEYDNLICVDIICHGVPSPKLWNKYLKWIESKNKSELKSINFRCKDIGWNNFGMGITYKDGSNKYICKDRDLFMQLFLNNVCLRPSCYNCKAKENKLSDITLGDFWGIQNVCPELNDDKGISIVILRNLKGEKEFKNIISNLIYKEVDYNKAVKNNPAEYKSVIMPLNRNNFFEDIDNNGLRELRNKYIHRSIKGKIKSVLSMLNK